MSFNILEIGPGSMPAPFYPGRLFDHPDVIYTAIEASADEAEKLQDDYYQKRIARFAGAILVGDSAQLPIEDESIDVVVSRSVFGEYTMSPQYTGSFLNNTHFGVFETFRVLRPGGRVYIAEENTPGPPATPWQIGDSLYNAGFQNIAVYPCQGMNNPFWVATRSDVWGLGDETDTHRIGEPIDSRWGYLITADRPDVALQEFTANIGDRSLWEARTHPWTREVSLKCSALAPNDGATASDEHITVVTKDDQFSLAHYFDSGMPLSLFQN